MTVQELRRLLMMTGYRDSDHRPQQAPGHREGLADASRNERSRD